MVYPLDKLLKLEVTGRAAIPYLGYVEVNLQIPDIRGYNEDIMLLVILTMTYAEKVLLVVGSKSIDLVMGIIIKGELAKATVTWRQAHFSAVMLGVTPVAPQMCKGDRSLRKGTPLQQPPTPLHIGGSTWMTSRGMSIPHAGSPFLCLGP